MHVGRDLKEVTVSTYVGFKIFLKNCFDAFNNLLFLLFSYGWNPKYPFSECLVHSLGTPSPTPPPPTPLSLCLSRYFFFFIQPLH